MSVSADLTAIEDSTLKRDLENAISAVLGNREGSWRVSISGSPSRDIWNLRISGGPSDIISSYTLRATDGQHSPAFVREFLTDLFTPFAAVVPDILRESWMKIAAGAASASDVKHIAQHLGRLWTIAPSDPAAFDDFVVRQGINQKLRPLSAEERDRFRHAFAEEVQDRIQITRHLVGSIAAGPFSVEFFNILAGLSTPLRELAYVTALRTAPDENRMLVLCRLSRDGASFIRDVLTWYSAAMSCGSRKARAPLICSLKSHLPM